MVAAGSEAGEGSGRELIVPEGEVEGMRERRARGAEDAVRRGSGNSLTRSSSNVSLARRNSRADSTTALLAGSDKWASVKRVLSEILTRLEGFSIMRRKVSIIEEYLTKLQQKINNSCTSNVVQIEALLFTLLECVRNLNSHHSVEEFIVAFSIVDTERQRVNDSLRDLTVSAGLGESGELMEKVIESDMKDDEVDGDRYRDIIVAIAEENQFQNAEHVKEVAGALVEALKASDVQEGSNGVQQGILDIGRHNIFRICSLIKKLVLEANLVLDNQIGATDVENVPEDLQGTFKTTVGGIVFHRTKLAGKEVFSLQPYSKENFRKATVYKFDQLPKRSRVEVREELKYWENLRHVNVLDVYGASFVSNSITLYLEVSDMTLFELLYKENYTLKKQQMETLIRSIARGLCFLHEKNLIHKHLSPHNIMVSHDLGVKIAGFGVSWIDQSIRTDFQRLFPYLPPEALVGQAKWVTGCDVYSFAMVAWEVTHRRRPFKDMQFGEVVENVTASNARPPFEKSSGIPEPWFEKLLGSCWEKRPDDRPSAEATLKVITKNTKSTARLSRRVFRSMLKFVPRRNSAGPRVALETLSKTELKVGDAVAAMSTLVAQCDKESALSKRSSNSDGGEWYFHRFWGFEGPSIVVTTMKKYPDNTTIQVAGCKILRTVGRSQFEPYFSIRQVSIVDQGGGSAILAAMEAHPDDPDIASHGCAALKSLCSTGEDTSSTLQRREVLANAGALRLILGAIETFPDNYEVQLNAFGALKNITFYHGAIRSEVVSEKTVVIMSTAKNFPQKELARYAAGTLMNLSFEEKNQKPMIEAGVSEILLQAMRDFPDEAAIQSPGFLAFWNLCFSDEDYPAHLVALGVIQVLKLAIEKHRDDSNVIANAFCLLDNLAWVDNIREELEAEGFFLLVKNQLAEHPATEEVWESGIAALKSLSWGERIQSIESLNLKWLFTTILDKFLQNSEVVRNGVLLLQNLTCEEPNLEPLFELGAHTWIMRAMSTYPDDSVIQESSCGALCNLSTPKSNKEAIFRAGVVVWIEKSMRKHQNNVTLQKNGCCALTRLARVDSILEEIKSNNFTLIAGLITAATLRFPEIKALPDLADIQTLFPLSEEFLENCSICLEPLCYDEVISAFQCEHIFHVRCVSKWTSVQSTCPLCRSTVKENFVPADDVSEVDGTYEEDEQLLEGFLRDNPDITRSLFARVLDGEDEEEDDDGDDDEEEDDDDDDDEDDDGDEEEEEEEHQQQQQVDEENANEEQGGDPQQEPVEQVTGRGDGPEGDMGGATSQRDSARGAAVTSEPAGPASARNAEAPADV